VQRQHSSPRVCVVPIPVRRVDHARRCGHEHGVRADA
jgi:hypothetical protein